MIEPSVDARPTVLLAGGEELVRRSVRAMLERTGYRILEATRGEDAVTISEEYPDKIDLLVTDVLLPQLTGRELARRATRCRPDLKVVYLSNFNRDEAICTGLVTPEASLLHKRFIIGDYACRSHGTFAAA